MRNQLRELLDEFAIDENIKPILIKKIVYLYEELLYQERVHCCKTILEYFNENPRIEDKEDLTLFLEEVEKELEVNMNEIEKSM